MLALLCLIYAMANAETAQRICYMEPTNRSFIGVLQVSLRTNVDQCKKECLSASISFCSSVIYVTRKSLCLLVSGQEDRTNESKDRNTMHFRRTCRRGARLQAALLKKACFEEFREKVLLGVVDEVYEKVSQLQCQKACAISLVQNNVNCKAAIYYPKEQECIIASQNRFDLPELFIEDEAAVYLENRCAIDRLANRTQSEDDNRRSRLLSTTEGAPDPSINVEAKSFTDSSDSLLKLLKKVDTEKADGRSTMEYTAKDAFSDHSADVSSSQTLKKGTTLHVTLKKPARDVIKQILQQPLKNELSGYEMNFSENSHSTYPKYTEYNAPAIDPETIDSYGLSPWAGFTRTGYETNPLVSYRNPIGLRRRNLRAHPYCFKKVQPEWISFEYFTVVRTLDECFTFCHQCKNCLKHDLACSIVTYNSKDGRCGLSSTTSSANFDDVLWRHGTNAEFYQKTECSTVGDVNANVSMYDISMYGTDKKNLTRKERMKKRARKMIKAGLREDQCYCCSLEGSPTTACLIIAGIIFLIVFCFLVFALMSAGVDFEATFAEPSVLV